MQQTGKTRPDRRRVAGRIGPAEVALFAAIALGCQHATPSESAQYTDHASQTLQRGPTSEPEPSRDQASGSAPFDDAWLTDDVMDLLAICARGGSAVDPCTELPASFDFAWQEERHDGNDPPRDRMSAQLHLDR